MKKIIILIAVFLFALPSFAYEKNALIASFPTNKLQEVRNEKVDLHYFSARLWEMVDDRLTCTPIKDGVTTEEECKTSGGNVQLSKDLKDFPVCCKITSDKNKLKLSTSQFCSGYGEVYELSCNPVYDSQAKAFCDKKKGKFKSLLGKNCCCK